MNRQVDVAYIEAVFPTILEEHSAYYVSTPITSGRMFVEWRSETRLKETDKAYVDEHRQRVIEVNLAQVRPLIQVLRRRLSVPVIDPTALKDVPGWTQEEYRYLWARVIKQYVATAVFMYGWEYSAGCSYEFLVAKESDVRTVDTDMREISVKEGLTILEAAIAEYRQADLPTEYLESIHRQLSTLPNGGGSS